MARLSVVAVLTLALAMSSVCNVEGLRLRYYSRSCPKAEKTIARIVRNAIIEDRRVGAGLIRIIFHDCFVQGCDASILIDSPNGDAEKNAIPNSFFTNFGFIDQIKAAVEAICPKTVSCADILAFSAAVSVSTLGGPRIPVKGGRLDGLVSNSSEVLQNIPSPFFTLAQLKTSFSAKGLGTKDLVLLSGAHTVGKGHCGAFTNRLYNFSSTSSVDPTLDSTYAVELQHQCPVNFANTTVANMDPVSPTFWDNAYFKDVRSKKGLFTSDAQLYTATDVKHLVDSYSKSNRIFSVNFVKSLIKLTQIGVKTGANGNIRTNCRSFT